MQHLIYTSWSTVAAIYSPNESTWLMILLLTCSPCPANDPQSIPDRAATSVKSLAGNMKTYIMLAMMRNGWAD